MAAGTEKEREREAREELILEHARRFLLRHGFQDWNMARLADAVRYAKGTLYLHFDSKEDLCLAVATRALRRRADLFEQAAGFRGRTRERIRAIGYACCEFACTHPDYFKVEMMLKSASFWEKATEMRRHEHQMQGARCFRSVHEIVKDGMRAGDLPPGRMTSEEASFALVAVTVGSHIMSLEPSMRLVAGIEDPIRPVRANQDLVCDGMGWKPLLAEWDYAATDERIRREIFPDGSWWVTSA